MVTVLSRAEGDGSCGGVITMLIVVTPRKWLVDLSMIVNDRYASAADHRTVMRHRPAAVSDAPWQT